MDLFRIFATIFFFYNMNKCLNKIFGLQPLYTRKKIIHSDAVVFNEKNETGSFFPIWKYAKRTFNMEYRFFFCMLATFIVFFFCFILFAQETLNLYFFLYAATNICVMRILLNSFIHTYMRIRRIV